MNRPLLFAMAALWLGAIPSSVNARGGGGCFPAGTFISTPEGEIPIERVKAGAWVTAIRKDGQAVLVKVQETHKTRASVIIITAGSKSLRTTPEHPICLADGGCHPAGNVNPDDKVLLWCKNKIFPTTVAFRPLTITTQEEVYNLTVNWPHTFVADGFVVHNKGGGGFSGGGFSGGGFHGGGFEGGGSGASDTNDALMPLVILGGIFFVGATLWNLSQYQDKSEEDLDYVFSPSQVAGKSDKTLKLLEFLSKQDPTVEPETLKKQAETTFLKLQECWQARNYEPMKSLMVPDIYANHCLQLQEMTRNHEINVIGNLQIDRIDLVNIRYTFKENQREFTALITATSCDHYIDDRSQRWLRGDKEPAQFQEFWTFQYLNKVWLLREIEQTKESNVLKEENFFEQFTNTGVNQIYGQDASKKGLPGPWLEKAAETKETRIERMLNFLIQTDKIWNRLSMLETTRRIFLELMAGWESGNPSDVPGSDFFPEVAEHLRETIAKNKEQELTLEFRNLCVRKVELILVRNFTDNSKDEFVARVRAHAQKIIRHNSQVIHQDEDVMPFEQYLTLGRLDNQWKLKEILSAQAGQAAMVAENLDEDSGPQQVQWYYQHKRAI